MTKKIGENNNDNSSQPVNWSSDFASFLASVLVKNPKDRPDAGNELCLIVVVMKYNIIDSWIVEVAIYANGDATDLHHVAHSSL